MSRKGLGTIPVDPKPTDILSGRGKATYTHPGNKRYLQAINSAIEEYVQETTKVGKTAIVRGIVQQMGKEKRRFLQRDSATDNWFELGRKAILDKVGHSLRDMKQTRILHKTPHGTPDGEKGMVPADGKKQMGGGVEGVVTGDDKGLMQMGFHGQRMDPAAVARLQQNYLGTYGGFSGLGGVGGLVPPAVDPHMLAARSRALAMGPPAAPPPMHPPPGPPVVAPVAPPPAQPPAASAIPPPPPPAAPVPAPVPTAPAATPAPAGGANKTKLDAILETTNMILKEREAIRALSAQGSFAPGAAVPPTEGATNDGATTNDDGRGEDPVANGSTQSTAPQDAPAPTEAKTEEVVAHKEPEKPTEEPKPPPIEGASVEGETSAKKEEATPSEEKKAEPPVEVKKE
uniref:DUF6824 domain-containing protein n=1 Tax=Grammatophora oceanica TaxID=210454 RepID=A0A7S1Y8K8_9STRA|eukprot:CAMPEP_0194048408 /NCGR_PEP_ID=MMETSP0009_2-20130614/27197_1 /TAXON_ID=210454 /ORGANISM="Grammatophora oceanica, Strain CCMP 410" /LENGTH=400 /DNA_ID=CAMNT_0038694261 /DNA_START=36 /DNA_END=1238 /DNA_ORIENTATION=+